MPSRTCPPSSRTTVTQMLSPIKSLSISFLVNTSMFFVLKLDSEVHLRTTLGFSVQSVSLVPE